MKKQLLFLPLISGLLLAGCNKTVKDSDLPPHTLREFQGYRLATKVQDGKKYLFGDYRHREDLMRFANGDYHRDGAKEYPFYMGTVGGTVKGAAEFQVKFINKSKGEFSLQCFAEGQVWNGKYVGAYAGVSSNDNKVSSIALLDDPKQTEYVDPQFGDTYKVSGIFKFYETYEGFAAYAPAIPFQYPNLEPEAGAKFFGSSMITQQDWDKGEADYISMDCKRWEEALSNSPYNLAHLYEKI